MSAILITGAAGTLGRALARRLSEDRPDETVVALDSRPMPEPPTGQRRPRLTVPFGGPFTPKQRSVLGTVTRVVHLAAEMDVATAPPGRRWTRVADPAHDLRALIAALPRLRHLVFASSYMVYATPPRHPLTEDRPLDPVNVYAWGKCAVEMYLRCLPLPSCSLRFAGVYGPGVPLDLGRSITEVLSAAVRGEEVRLYGPGTSLRNHLYVDDAVEALYRAVTENWSGTYNVAGPEGVSVHDVVDAVAKAAGRPVPVRWNNGPPGWDAVLDTGLIAGDHGYRAVTAPADGLREHYRWATTEIGRTSR